MQPKKGRVIAVTFTYCGQVYTANRNDMSISSGGYRFSKLDPYQECRTGLQAAAFAALKEHGAGCAQMRISAILVHDQWQFWPPDFFLKQVAPKIKKAAPRRRKSTQQLRLRLFV